MPNTNFCFSPGKITYLLDCQAGSSGKAKTASYVGKYANNWSFACNTFNPQAGHWSEDNGHRYFYQTLNSIAYMPDKYEKIYIGQGGMIEVKSLFREIEESNVPTHKIGISPIASILLPIDSEYERGICDLDGNKIEYRGVAMKSGSTCHGCGANRARKLLRKQNVVLARDIPELKEFICDVPGEILERLRRGEAGFGEIAQGFQLSMGLPEMYPFCTSRNATVAAALDDMMLPTFVAGQVIINMRTYPIRINSRKYVTKEGKHLTWTELQSGQFEYNIEESYSGDGYPDQEETTWEQITKDSGSPVPIVEMTSVTKMPRRVFTFSKKNVIDAIIHNNTGHDVILALNFANYIEHELTNFAGQMNEPDTKTTFPASALRSLGIWVSDNIDPIIKASSEVSIKADLGFIGTGAGTDAMIQII